MEKIILLGGGGHAKVMIDLIRTLNHYENAGILDLQLKVGLEVANIPILGKDDLLSDLFNRETNGRCNFLDRLVNR